MSIKHTLIKHNRDRRIIFELSLVLMVSIVPAIFNSMTYSSDIDHQNIRSFSLHAWSMLIRSLRDIVLISFVIVHSGRAFAVFGIRRLHIPWDLSVGIGLWALGWLLVRLVWISLPIILTRSDYWNLTYHQYHPNFEPPIKISEYGMAIISCFANGTAEELVVRAYLITRLEELIESRTLALLLSTIIFVSYHGYQGLSGVISVTILGCIYGVYYSTFRRVAPIAIAHAIADCVAELRI